ncbi:MAG: hypothetical protein EXR71_06285 [Myxococcales bacterium]|nr:hypothetical protein [Myxococcales bacterium]
MLSAVVTATLAHATCGACTAEGRAYQDYVEEARAASTQDHPEPAYLFAAEAHQQLAMMSGERPGVVQPFRIGASGADRPIWALRLVDPAVPPRGSLLVLANIHALEWVPTEVAVAFALDFARSPVAGAEIVLIPSLNVDGRALVEADLRAGRDVYRRGNAARVDLNRDFGVNRDSRAIWKALIPSRYLVSPAPLSQPESRALDALAASERFDAAVSLHAFGGFFYSPWAGRWKRPGDHAEFGRLGVLMQAAMVNHPYRPRQLSRWGFFFRGLGMELDHLYGTYGTYAFLVETTRSGVESPADLDSNFRIYNPRDPRRHAAEGVRYLRALATEIASGRVKARRAP